jgi:hypothetical protein
MGTRDIIVGRSGPFGSGTVRNSTWRRSAADISGQ